MLGLEIPRQSQAVNLGWLLLVLGLGFTKVSCCLFERIQEVVQHEPIPAIHMEKQLEWSQRRGEAVSGDVQGRSNSVSQVDGVSDMAPAYWLSWP